MPLPRRSRGPAAAVMVLSACSPPSTSDLDCPMPLSVEAEPADPARASRDALGARLFFDPRLSATGEVACVSCHDLGGGSGTIKSPFARGIEGRLGARNPPTVWNAAMRSALFWDGRAEDLEAQARGPLTNPDEMGMSEESVVRVVESLRGYREAFALAFAEERRRSGRKRITFAEVASAIASFERTLLTPDAPLDRACRGERSTISEQAWRGFRTFRDVGCIACHGAPTFGGRDYFVRFPLRPVPDLDFALGFTRDIGRGAVVAQTNARNTWRVPSLRNSAVTGPYFHNGSIASLDQAVRVMGRAQLGRTLSDAEVDDIVAFLATLTGVRPAIPTPELPVD